MQKPKMILFDYGQTLVNEKKFDAIKGNEAVLSIATKNPENITAHELQQQVNRVFKESQRIQESNRHEQLLEINCKGFDTYVYESLGLEFDVDMEEVQGKFWDNATLEWAEPTEGIQELLAYLQENNIRTGVISNMMNSSGLLKRRIDTLIPQNWFEFYLASNSYLFRKPHPFIFEMATKKAKLKPEEIWFCGDNLLCDIEGAFNFGMKPVFYPTYIDCEYSVDTKVPYMEIGSWKELIEYIRCGGN